MPNSKTEGRDEHFFKKLWGLLDRGKHIHLMPSQAGNQGGKRSQNIGQSHAQTQVSLKKYFNLFDS